MPLSPEQVAAEFNKLRAAYAEDPRQSTFNALVCGEAGSGKTFLARTCRKPVLIDSFDPGGTKGLRDWINRGEIMADTRWENENRLSPSVYQHWMQVTDTRLRAGFFDNLGTYMLDSLTMLGEAAMNWVLSGASRAGEQPKFTKDYGPQKVQLQNMISKIISLPCDFILTGHLEQKKDEGEGTISYRLMATGALTVLVPMLFDELYVMEPTKMSDGVKYRILTQSTGRYTARSRMAGDGKLATYETPDIKAMLKKCGMPTDDKPLFK